MNYYQSNRRDWLKKAITAFISIVFALIFFIFLFTAVKANPEAWGITGANDTYEDGARIRHVRGHDYIVTDDGHGGERLTLMPDDNKPTEEK